jgi:hypothetical protein
MPLPQGLFRFSAAFGFYAFELSGLTSLLLMKYLD